MREEESQGFSCSGQAKATQSRFADYRHRPHAIWKILFIIHYLYEFAQIIQTFNIAVSKTFVSP